MLPLSKSVELRRLVMAYITGYGHFTGADYPAGQAADIHYLADALTDLAAFDFIDCRYDLFVDEPPLFDVNIGEGGAPLRFFMALAASRPNHFPITVRGEGRLPHRPSSILIDALNQCGADVRISPDAKPGEYLPVIIHGREIEGGEIDIDCTVSSQYISALMMASVLWKKGLTLRFIGGKPVSMPYIRMTAKIMTAYGCDVTLSDTQVRVNPGYDKKKIKGVPQEADWSAASFLYEAKALLPNLKIEIPDLLPPGQSLQGDSRCAELFSTMEKRFPNRLNEASVVNPIDLTSTPDLVPPLAVALTLRGIPFTLTGVKNLRIKESDRIAALIDNLGKLGYILTATEDTLTFEGEKKDIDLQSKDIIEIDTYGDHRIAMAFGIASLVRPEIHIADKACVAKSFPLFWQTLTELNKVISNKVVREYGSDASSVTKR